MAGGLVLSSPNLATALLGFPYSTIDQVFVDSPIPMEYANQNPGNSNFCTQSTNPFSGSTNPFNGTIAGAESYTPDDIQRLQVQLYHELRFQVAQQEGHLLEFEPSHLSYAAPPLYQDVDSLISTIDTPVFNTSSVGIGESFETTEMRSMGYGFGIHGFDTPATSFSQPQAMLPGDGNSVTSKSSVSSSVAIPISVQAMLLLVSLPTSTSTYSALSPKSKKPVRRRQIKSRLRSGCWICRIKHLKCDETHPACQNCARSGIECDYSSDRPQWVNDKILRKQKLASISTKKKFASHACLLLLLIRRQLLRMNMGFRK